MLKFKSVVSLSLCAVLLCTSCGTVNRTAIGIGAGSAAGAAAGAGIGYATGNIALGTAIGTVVGGVAGGLIGRHMDKQKQELEQVLPEGTGVELVNDGEAIKVTLESGILFATNSTTLSNEAKSALRHFAANLQSNPDTDITIEGHTDNTGAPEYNETLSKDRALSVYHFLQNQGISQDRMIATGKSFHEPIASNSTVEGRLQNRRVEIFISPNAKMIQEAKAEATK